MPYLRIRALGVSEDLTFRGKYPDLWTDGHTITVTREWARQSLRERKKRLLHEALHVAGYPHMPRVGFYSRPEDDRFSGRVLDMIERAIPLRI